MANDAEREIADPAQSAFLELLVVVIQGRQAIRARLFLSGSMFQGDDVG